MWFKSFLIALCAIGFSSVSSSAAEQVDCTVIVDQNSVQPGHTAKIGVELTIPQGQHIYGREPGDTGFPTSIEWILPEGVQVEGLNWPQAQRFEEEGLVSNGYLKKVLLWTNLHVSERYNSAEIKIQARVKWLACGEGHCIPGQKELVFVLPVSSSAPVPSQAASSFPASTAPAAQTPAGSTGTLSLPYCILLAFAAGLLLNLMPCVLPVLGLKVMSLAKQSQGSRLKSIQLGLAYSAGTIATFAVLATFILVARSSGVTLGWGFQFQSLTYLVMMCSIICLMTLSLFGMFYVQIQTGVQSLEDVASRGGLIAAFARGASATLLSTPCSAPLLGTALGFALGQPAIWVVCVLLSVGAGLASPYMVLSCFPSWLKFLPKPGDWMERFKEAMGFLMLGTLVWMLSVILNVAGGAALIGCIMFLFTLTLATWGVVRFASAESTLLRKSIVWALAAALCAGSFYKNVYSVDSSAPAASEHSGLAVYSEASLESHLAQGKTVLVDVTAEWCLTCKLNESILASTAVTEAMQKNNVLMMRADWTRGDENVSKLLKRFSRPGVPMYVIFQPGKEPVVLPELLTPSIVIDAIETTNK